MKTKQPHTAFFYTCSVLMMSAAMILITGMTADKTVPAMFGTDLVSEYGSAVTDTGIFNKTVSVTYTDPQTATSSEILLVKKEISVSAHIDIKNILQNPELPTGCEITSLAQVLCFYNYNADKELLADNYLTKAMIGEADLNTAFISDPRSERSYGCNAPVIVDAAEKYLADNGHAHVPVNITGSDPYDLYSLIDSGIPVIVWSTIALEKAEESYLWDMDDGNSVYFMINEHCTVLTGYNFKTKTVSFSDPLYGKVTYSMSKFEERFEQMGRQAIYIESSDGYMTPMLE